ncbi:unique cartilage matrix-associated protein-like isoform X1 [Sinocyclocheilus rhinocerous]|uniref:unique cartilage matrix-associated protein-like isoform X1 n=1 Tax=Sinocyclocheilus rhinocerous TaxID=307959 RepID=UPI0007B94E43|nr:PREDICTED: unique cartilage matrix-associated protein-like isoform X1 [Sinocyclocheilus rhinocerous]
MSWTRPLLLTCLVVLSVITLFHEADSAAVSDKKAASPQGALRKIFMPEADASSFFKRRGKRAVKTQDEINAEQRQRLAADERRMEYHEEQSNEFESYAEEEHDGESTQRANSNHSPGGHIGSSSVSSVLRSFTQVNRITHELI